VAAACSERGPRPSLVRLTELGTTQPVPLPKRAANLGANIGGPREQSRPAVILAPGQARSCHVVAARGSQLHVALGFRNPPTDATLEVAIRAGGKVLASVRIPAASHNEWQRVRVPLEREGPLTLEFTSRLLGPDGRPAAAPPSTEMLIGSPRVTTPRAGRARRVLVWISQDTLRSDHVGAYGYGRATTAGFDRMAPRWALFEDAVAPAPWTLPSLASQFTARYPSFHGAVLDSVARGGKDPTIFEALAAADFTVLGVTGNRFVSTDFGTASGFDALWFTPERAEDVSDLARQALDETDQEDLALFVHYMDPHFPYSPPPPFDRQFATGYSGSINGDNFIKRSQREVNPADLAHVEALYDGEIAYTDRQIEALLEALGARGLLDTAVIAYSADHGEGFLEHGKWLHTMTLYRELLQVPLALRVPGIPGQRVARPVSLVDLAPTLLEALGVPVPKTFQGRSLMPLMRGGSLAPAPIYAETEQTANLETHKLAVREGRLKYAVAVARGSGPLEVVKEEAYDVVADPQERRPLGPAPEVEPLKRHALAFLGRARAEQPAAVPASLTESEREQLRALGYLQ